MYRTTRLLAILIIALTIVGFGAIPTAKAADTSIYTNLSAKFSLRFPKGWSKQYTVCDKSQCSISFGPDKATIAKLTKNKTGYSIILMTLGTTASPLTAAEKTAMKKSWSAFVSATAKEIRDSQLANSVRIDATTVKGFTASKLTVKIVIGKSTVIETLYLMTKDKKTVYLLEDAWAYTKTTDEKNPFAITFLTFVQSFRILK